MLMAQVMVGGKHHTQTERFKCKLYWGLFFNHIEFNDNKKRLALYFFMLMIAAQMYVMGILCSENEGCYFLKSQYLAR